MAAQWAMDGLDVKSREKAIFGLETVRPFSPG